jgi:hypothetical protein
MIERAGRLRAVTVLLASCALARAAAAGEVPFLAVVVDAGMAGDCKMAGDLDGDGRADLVVWPRPSNYRANQTRANQAIVRLSGRGQFDVRCSQASGTAHVVIDINGWFE